MKKINILILIIVCVVSSVMFYGKNMESKSVKSIPTLQVDLSSEYYKIAPDYISKGISKVEIVDQVNLSIAKIKIDPQDNSKSRVTINSHLVFQNGNLNKSMLIPALIHEIGHQISINDVQIDLQNQNNSVKQEFAELENGCKPRYYLRDGCTKSDSYLNNWYKLFWQDIWSDFQELQSIKDGTKFSTSFTAFCNKYEDQFVDINSCYNPEEDFAETFKVFVMDDKLDHESTIMKQKIDFFRKDIFLNQLKKDITERIR
jgi:hypothetical protein